MYQLPWLAIFVTQTRALVAPLKFGDRPDPDTVEGHRNRVVEPAKTCAYHRRMKELSAEDELTREGLLSKVFGFFFSSSRRY